jgi:hypothetical protein
MGRLYSITGAYLEEGDSSIDFFGGYFAKREEDDYFIGQSIDSVGPSSIEGMLSGNSLLFNQKYFGQEELIEYDLEYNEEYHLWIGKISYLNQEVGTANCVIFPAFKNIDFKGMPHKKILIGREVYEILTLMDINELNLD